MGKTDFGISRAEITFMICEAIAILFYGIFTEFDDLSSTKTKVDYKTVEKAE